MMETMLMIVAVAALGLVVGLILFHVCHRHDEKMLMIQMEREKAMLPEVEAMANRIMENAMKSCIDMSVEMTKKIAQEEWDGD